MIITVPEAREILRIDGEDNDLIIVPLIEAIPDYLEVTTGRRWEYDNPINPLAKTTAGFILQLWFEAQDHNTERLKRTIDSLLAALTAIGRNVE
jgi:hypothetical protein